jgi:hypothetical protein
VRWLAIALVATGCAGCDDPKYTVEQLQDPTTCMECHPKHYEQWSGSMHAYASEDPVFIAMNKRGQRDTNGELGDFCIQCHAPMALELGLATGATFDLAALPPAAKGITCYFCHNVESVTTEHNNGLVLAMDQTMRGGTKNAVDNPAHHSKYDTLMASKTNNSTMCGSCHDVVTPKGVHIERTFAEWKTTVFALDDPANFLPQTCSKCHMEPFTDVIADMPGVTSREYGFHEHYMAGLDEALTPFPDVEGQAAAVQKILQPSLGIISPRILGSRETYGGICLDPPGELTVRIDSLTPGHMFPSGAAQDRRVWLEVIAYRADNSIVFESGRVPDGVDPEALGDPYLDCPTGGAKPCRSSFWDRTFKDNGMPAHFFWEVATIDGNLIRPAITRDQNSPLYDHSSKVFYTVPLHNEVDRIVARVLVRALPYAVIDDLVASGDLDPAVRGMLKTHEIAKSTWLRATKGTGLAMNTNCNPF